MRKVLSLCCVLALILSTLSMNVGAVTVEASETVFCFEDGSYCVITLEEGVTRASGTKNGTKNYSYYSGNNDLLWVMSLSGTFTYSGTTASCTSASARITIYNDSWYTEYKASNTSGSSALGVASMGRKVLGVTVEKRTVELTLTCDANGNLS